MNSDSHRSTLALADDRLMSASAFHRNLRHDAGGVSSVMRGTRATKLSPSMLADLDRFGDRPDGADLLELVAACVRHGCPLVLFLEVAGRVLPLRLFPSQALFVCPMDFLGMPEAHVRRLRVVRVDPGIAQHTIAGFAPGADAEHTGPLSALLWQLTMHGERYELLPEIDGRVCYRVSWGWTAGTLPIDDAALALLQRMRRECLALDDLAALPGVGLERACRLLNGVYLQSGLLTLRSAPAARLSTRRPVGARRPD